MMTEEDTGTENNYIRHRQGWRSCKFNSLMDKLDGSKNIRSLAKQREVGLDVVRSTPPNAKKWMITGDSNEAQLTEHSDEDQESQN